MHFTVKDGKGAGLQQWFEDSDVAFKFNKLAIYEEDGHFLKHRDTAYAANHKGTLLVNIPSKHKGGDLVLRPAGKEVVTWKTSGKKDNLDCLLHDRPS